MRVLIAAALLCAAPALATIKGTSLGGAYTTPDFTFDRYASFGKGNMAAGQLVVGSDFVLLNQNVADFGMLKTQAAASFNNYPAATQGGGFGVSAAALSFASFTDVLIVDSIDPVGKATVKVNLDGLITGFLGATGTFGDSRAYLNLYALSQDGRSSARFELSNFIGWDPSLGQIENTTRLYEEWTLFNVGSDASTTNGGNFFGNHDWTFGFDVNQAWSITATMGCLAYVSDYADGSNNSLDCDLGHTFTWQGVSFVTPGGQPITTGVTVQSISGQNYTQVYQPFTPVPEPASWAMLIAGFGLAGAAQRRRRLLAA